MKRVKKKATKDQHTKYSFAIKLATRLLVFLKKEIDAVYGKDTKTAKTAQQALNIVNQLKHQLEGRLWDETYLIPNSSLKDITYRGLGLGAPSKVLRSLEWLKEDLLATEIIFAPREGEAEEPPSPSKGKGDKDRSSTK